MKEYALRDIVEQPGLHLEELVDLTDGERLRFRWFRLRLAIRGAVPKRK